MAYCDAACVELSTPSDYFRWWRGIYLSCVSGKKVMHVFCPEVEELLPTVDPKLIILIQGLLPSLQPAPKLSN